MQFLTRTALAVGMRELFAQLEQRLRLNRPVVATLAGGMATYLYTGQRPTLDVDTEFSIRVLLPTDLIVDVLVDGEPKKVYFDANYNPTFALLHEDYLQDAIPVPFHLEHIEVRVLAPVDLAVSKIARLADVDRQDIAELVFHGLTTAAAIETRATDALVGYVGEPTRLAANLRDALAIAHDAEGRRRNLPPARADVLGMT